MASLTQENNELASRLVEVTLELAQLKEDQVRRATLLGSSAWNNRSLLQRT